MPSAAEECREPPGKCRGIDVVWRVVTLYSFSLPTEGWLRLSIDLSAWCCAEVVYPF